MLSFRLHLAFPRQITRRGAGGGGTPLYKPYR